MTSPQIVIGSLIEWLDEETDLENERTKRKIYRVLWMDLTERKVVLYEIFNEKALPEWYDLESVTHDLESEKAIKITYDPFSNLANPQSDFLLKHQDKRNNAWDKIKDIVVKEPEIYLEEGRGILIHSVAESYKVHPMTIYKWLRRYWAGGKIKNALLPAYNKCGAPGQKRIANEGVKRGRPNLLTKTTDEPIGINMNEDIERIFSAGLSLYYDKRQKSPMTRAYQLTIARFYNTGFREVDGVQVPVLPPASELPSLWQFKTYAQKKLDPQKSYEKREGVTKFALNNRPKLGNSTQMAMGPGSVYQFDATIADIYLVSSFDRTCIIGRPVLYIVIDVFSRMITGLYIGLEGPSWLGAMIALANTTTDKVSYCEQYGVIISSSDWPCAHLPETILADRGEMESYNADNLVDSLNITVSNTAPYRADWKGIVEQAFRIANLRVIHWLPGAVKERYRERGQKDNRLDATLTLEEFTKIIIKMVLNHNLERRLNWYKRDEFMIQDHIEPIPIDLWNWGIANRSGHLREKSPEIIMLNLMPRDEAAVTNSGIIWNKMRYSCERAIQEQWFVRAKRRQWKVPIAYDPRSVNNIYLLLNQGKDIEPCRLLEVENRYKDRRLEEVLDLLVFEKMASTQNMFDRMQSDASLNADIGSIVEEAQEKTTLARKEKGQSNSQMVKNIKKNRAEEKQRRREEEAWDLTQDKKSIAEKAGKSQKYMDNSAEEPLIPVTHSKRKATLEMLMRQRKEGE